MNSVSVFEQPVLIVESDSKERRNLASIVQDLGLACVEASSGWEAIAKIRENLPMMILINTTAPEANVLISPETYTAIPELNGVPVVDLSDPRQSAATFQSLRGS